MGLQTHNGGAQSWRKYGSRGSGACPLMGCDNVVVGLAPLMIGGGGADMAGGAQALLWQQKSCVGSCSGGTSPGGHPAWAHSEAAEEAEG